MVVDRAWLRRGSRFKSREHILVSYSYWFELIAIVAKNKPVLEKWKRMMEFEKNCAVWPFHDQ